MQTKYERWVQVAVVVTAVVGLVILVVRHFSGS